MKLPTKELSDALIALRSEGATSLNQVAALMSIASCTRAKGILLCEIARAISITPAGMTNIVDVLEKAGLVARVTDDRDRRMLYIKLTKKGEDFLRTMFDFPTHNPNET